MSSELLGESGKQDRTVLLIGEALIDMVVQFGDEVTEAVPVPGGSPANVALALGRLDVPVELITWAGKDAFGSQIREHLALSNVRVGEDSMGAAETSRAIASLDQNNAATYSFILEWAPKDPIVVPDSAVVVHTGSIGAVLEPGASTVLNAVQSAADRALITYDPNVRPQIMSDMNFARNAVEAMVANADVVKASDEDLKYLYPDLDVEQAALRWIKQFDLPLLVVTRGNEGPKGWIGEQVSRTVEPADVKVIDTVGAGDTFMGGLIDALWRRDIVGAEGREKLRHLDGDTLQSILDEAAALADVVVQRRGANPPWSHELDR